MTQASVAGT